MSKRLKYKIISCSSQQAQFPSSSLLFNGQNGGWQTKRFCTYPQQVTFEFYGPVRIEKITMISDGRKVPSQVDILYFMPFLQNGRQAEQKFQKYGYLNFNKSQNQMNQQKSIMVEVRCLYLRFLFHKPYNTKQNFFSQIGIQQVSIFGSDSNSSLAPVQKLPRQIGQMTGGTSYPNTIQQDPFVSQKIALLNAQKERAVQVQDFETANQYKQMIETVRKAGQQLKKLQASKRQAIQDQDYQKAKNLKNSIENHRRQLDSLISEDYGDSGMEENQFANNNEYNNNTNGNQNAVNDFHDNQFVDPEMNEIMNMSEMNNKSQVQNNRVTGPNSRVKVNKTLLMRKEKEKPYDNYQDRVIPTLAGGTNKSKVEDPQFLQKQGENKVQLQLQQIDGKFIQFATIIQEHFEQDTVKRLFSQPWQLKIQALGTISSQIKKRPSANASFIKCLIVVVKNSILQTNFQVGVNSLQLLGDMLRLNSKNNVLTRTNQVSNDLDSISREVIKKMADNNNKIKKEAEKVIAQMVNSSLYGAENCAIAMAKTKQKVKLSSKQILTRLAQIRKIVVKQPNNQNILGIAADFGIEQIRNPAAQVRNESLNLLLICKEKDTSGVIEKKLSQKDILSLLQAYQSKTGTKGQQKGKKKK